MQVVFQKVFKYYRKDRHVDKLKNADSLAHQTFFRLCYCDIIVLCYQTDGWIMWVSEFVMVNLVIISEIQINSDKFRLIKGVVALKIVRIQ